MQLRVRERVPPPQFFEQPVHPPHEPQRPLIDGLLFCPPEHVVCPVRHWPLHWIEPREWHQPLVEPEHVKKRPLSTQQPLAVHVEHGPRCVTLSCWQVQAAPWFETQHE